MYLEFRPAEVLTYTRAEPPGADMHVCAVSHFCDYSYVFAARLLQDWHIGALLCMSAAILLHACGAGEADQPG